LTLPAQPARSSPRKLALPPELVPVPQPSAPPQGQLREQLQA